MTNVLLSEESSVHNSERQVGEIIFEDKNILDINGGRTYIVTISAVATIDGATVDCATLDTQDYLRNPVVLFAHDRWAIPVGRTLALDLIPGGPEGQVLQATFEFLPGDEFAARVENAWARGFLNAASISWKTTDDGINKLKEWSIVPVPADPHALREAQMEFVANAILGDDYKQDKYLVGDRSMTEEFTITTTNPENENGDFNMPNEQQLVDFINAAAEAAADRRDAERMRAEAEQLRAEALLMKEEIESATAALPSVGATPSVAVSADFVEQQNLPSVAAIDPEALKQEIVSDLKDIISRELGKFDELFTAQAETQERAEETVTTPDRKTAEQVDVEVRRRAEIIDMSRGMLPESFGSPYDKTDHEILIAALGLDDARNEMNDDVLYGQLSVMRERHDNAAQERQDVSEKIENSEQRTDDPNPWFVDPNAKDFGEMMGFGVNDASRASYDKYLEEIQNAWKQ